MRLGGISLLGLLAVLAIIAVLTAHALSHASPTSTTGTGAVYGKAISAAQQSVAEQNAAAAQSQANLP